VIMVVRWGAHPDFSNGFVVNGGQLTHPIIGSSSR
jgi:hypothetical protein